ncbi:alpha/beta-hydrolase [Polyporus arcularius HHB13444]|uniref:Alpha/beta-hydrolase n=1 Tax=Polyporus arcularius HHB13444 TaxID=1314778 RepID=A0A5C3Q044_9APHY|nr:alpha/beta-hydrolase [Polyporus arcularius HHB13444]
MSTCEAVPLVVVEGFLSGAGALVWGNFNYACRSNGEKDRRTIFAVVGPVSSLHDRACELFYSLVGGTVDYGEKHAEEYGHDRFGRTHEVGLYPDWSVDHPLHFLGHSLGGQTIIKLQWMLSTGFFGRRYHPDMILSVNTVSTPFRGTQLVYALGEETQHAPDVRPFSAGDLLAKGVHIAAYLSPLLPSFLDPRVDYRKFSYRHTSFTSFLGQLWKSDWAESRDAAPYDVTFDAASDREAMEEGAVNANTYYRSYCATMVNSSSPSTSRATTSLVQKMLAWPLYFSSWTIASFPFSSLRPIPAFVSTLASAYSASIHSEKIQTQDGTIDVDRAGSYLSTALRANDGVVPLFSQWHPFECKFTSCRHVSHSDSILGWDETRYGRPPDAGVWHVHHLEDAHHLSIAPFWLGTAEQEAFWKDMGHWLRCIDEVRRSPRCETGSTATSR